jgi:predicted branched-subunit amino acid permease
MTMTDETYAVNCTVDGETKRGRKIIAALFSWCYWMVGSVIGGVVGYMLQFRL